MLLKSKATITVIQSVPTPPTCINCNGRFREDRLWDGSGSVSVVMCDACGHRHSSGKQDYKKIHALPARRSRLHMDPCFRGLPFLGNDGRAWDHDETYLTSENTPTHAKTCPDSPSFAGVRARLGTPNPASKREYRPRSRCARGRSAPNRRAVRLSPLADRMRSTDAFLRAHPRRRPQRIDSVRTTLYNGARIPASIHSSVEGWPSG
jgi:hypothetical protein